MSQSINGATAPAGSSVLPPAPHWWVAIIGITVAALLGYGTAMVVTGQGPWAEDSTAVTVEAVGVAEAQPTPTGGLSVAEIAELRAQDMVEYFAGQAESSIVMSDALDPVETQFVSPQLESAVGAGGLSVAEIAELRAQDMVEYFAGQAESSIVMSDALDPVETQFVSPQLESAVGAGISPASSSPGAVVLSPQAIAALLHEDMVEYFESPETQGQYERSTTPDSDK